MRILTALTAGLLATEAAAHPGHLLAVSGHDHWGLALPLAALGIAVVAIQLGRRA